MSAKQLLFRDQAHEKIRRGIDALADAVKVTLGPRGRTVLLEREFVPPRHRRSHGRSGRSTDDVLTRGRPCQRALAEASRT